MAANKRLIDWLVAQKEEVVSHPSENGEVFKARFETFMAELPILPEERFEMNRLPGCRHASQQRIEEGTVLEHLDLSVSPDRLGISSLIGDSQSIFSAGPQCRRIDQMTAICTITTASSNPPHSQLILRVAHLDRWPYVRTHRAMFFRAFRSDRRDSPASPAGLLPA